MSDPSIRYYDENADAYAARTLPIDMIEHQQRFLSYLPPRARVLDAGCGAGRDAKAFLAAGLRVTAYDASPELAKIASRESGLPVRVVRHQDIDFNDEFDGIWASATLIHVPRRDLGDVLHRFAHALTGEGVLYASLQMGEADQTDEHGRVFSCFSKGSFKRILIQTRAPFEILECTTTASRGARDIHWLNFYLRKTS